MKIALLGWMGSGKDSVAEHLSISHNFVKDSFAASLKDSVAALFGWPRELLEGVTLESRKWREEVDPWWSAHLSIPDFTPRKALQLMGTEVLREHFHTDIWLLTFRRRFETQHVGKNVLVSDCRFKNEIEFFKSLGGKLVFVDSGVKPEWYDIAVAANTSEDIEQSVRAVHIMTTTYSHIHRSEWDWVGLGYDYVIDNHFLVRDSRTYSALKTRVDDMVQRLG